VSDVKDSNPKDVAGSARIDFTLISPFAMAEETLALEEGGSKYGYYNYQVVGVKNRVYIAAIFRHAFKYLMGEERDPKTGVHHLGSIRACAGIIIDAKARGKLIDNRPPSHKGASSLLDSMEARVRQVRDVFATFNPRHFTIEDTQDGNGTREQNDSGASQEAAAGDLPGEDAQHVQGRDTGRMVQRNLFRPLG